MMYDEDLLKIPVDKLLALDGLVVVWCTNSKQHINYLIDTVFPVWKISYLTTWYWVKVIFCQFYWLEYILLKI